jgi:hypothetical protein
MVEESLGILIKVLSQGIQDHSNGQISKECNGTDAEENVLRTNLENANGEDELQ